MAPKKPRTFRVVEGVSTRESTDFDSADYGEFVQFRPGRKITEDKFPAHAPLDEWLKSGHLEVVEDE
jgi:hypothetical protein